MFSFFKIIFKIFDKQFKKCVKSVKNQSSFFKSILVVKFDMQFVVNFYEKSYNLFFVAELALYRK